MNIFLEIISFIFIFFGGLFCVVGGIGIIRMPDFYTRLHAASIIDTLGAGFLLIGLVIHAGFSLVSVKLIFISILIFFASPTSTHALAKAAKHKRKKAFFTTKGEKK